MILYPKSPDFGGATSNVPSNVLCQLIAGNLIFATVTETIVSIFSVLCDMIELH
jgi:hypothetical protein